MTKLVKIEGENGDLLFESEIGNHRLEEIGVMDGVINGISGTTSRLNEVVQSCLDSIAPVIEREHSKENSALQSAELSFGISVDGEGDVYVVKVAGGANLEIKLTWNFEGD